MSVGVTKVYARQALRPAETLSVSSTLEAAFARQIPQSATDTFGLLQGQQLIPILGQFPPQPARMAEKDSPTCWLRLPIRSL